MTVEDRLDRLEQSLRRWRTVTVSLVLIMVIGVTVAQTKPEVPEKMKVKEIEAETISAKYIVADGIMVDLVTVRDMVRCRGLEVVDNEGTLAVRITALKGGFIEVSDPDGTATVVIAGVSLGEDGTETVVISGGSLGEDEKGHLAHRGGKIALFDKRSTVKSPAFLRLMNTENGGTLSLSNKSGEVVVQLRADEYGNGVVGAYNRKGKGRTLKPGP